MSEKLRILLFEDNPGDADLIEEMLTGAGVSFKLKCATRLAEGIELIKTEGCDVILLDLGLPDSQGLGTLKKLNEAKPEAPVIVLTGLADDVVGTNAVKEGAQDYLIKGQIDKHVLARAVHYAIERKKYQEILRESEERYKVLFNNSIDAVLLTKPDGTILAANTEACRLFDCSEEELCIGGRDGVIDPADPRMAAALEERARTGRFKGELLLKKKGGSKFPGEISSALFKDRNGNVMTSMIIRDITERKKTEEALRKSEELNRKILESVGEGFLVIDRNYRIIAANRAFCEQEQAALQDIIGQRCYVCSHHSDTPCHERGLTCPLELTIETGLPNKVLHVHEDKKGNPVHVEVRSFPLKDASGEVTAVIEIINDITGQIKLEDQLRHAQKMEAVGTLAGGIAHDFNNILNVIMGFGTLVLDGLAAADPLKNQMNEVLAAAEKAVSLTRRLLVFSRKQVVDIRPVDVNEVVAGIQKMLARIIRENIEFNLDLAGSSLTVMADAGQLEQVLINLAANARDAMPEGGRLTIATGVQKFDEEYVAAYGYGKPGMYALITVSDTGHGMDEETQKKIFEPFFTMKGIGEGTGLGLAISYGIIKQHGGYIRVYSEQGKGSTFKIYLPLVEAEAASGPGSELPGAVRGGSETILVAEDDASLRKLTRIVLESFGYTVVTAEDGDEAVTKFMENRENIRLAMLDMIMPKKNGKEVSEVLRKESPGIKVLFASGYTMDLVKTRELAESGCDFILKPVPPKDLLRKVREILDRGNEHA